MDFILRCLFLITRHTPSEEVLTQLETEPTTLSLPTNIPPQAADVACLVMPPHSRTNSVSTPYNDRSRANSHSSITDQNDTEIII